MEPRLDELQTWEPTSANVSRLEQTKICYINTRHEAKTRLFHYWQKKNGIVEKRYNPFEGTEIGKSIPILNF
jgi:hypothetical protein